MTSGVLESRKLRKQSSLLDLAFKLLPGVMSWDHVYIEENCIIVVFLTTNCFAVLPLHTDISQPKYRKILSLENNLELLPSAAESSFNNSYYSENMRNRKPIGIIYERDSELLIKYYSVEARLKEMREEQIFKPKCHFGNNYEGHVIGCEPYWQFIAYWKSKKSSWWPSRSTVDETTTVFVGPVPKTSASDLTATLEEHKLELEGSWHLPFMMKVRNERNINGNVGVLGESLTLNFLSQENFNQLLQVNGNSVRDSVISSETYFNARSKQTIIELLPSDDNLLPPIGIWSWPQVFEGRAYFYIFVNSNGKEQVGELWSLHLSDFRWKKEKFEWNSIHVITAHRPVLTITEKGSAFVNMECVACCCQHVFQYDIGSPKNVIIDWNRKLGGGLFGNVFAGESSTINQLAAKTIKISDERGSSLVAQQKLIFSAIDGARRLRSASHPNIIKGFGFVLEQERIIHFTELMAQTLLHVIKVSNSFEENHAIRVLLSISDALFYLHSLKPMPIVHGDIKCANIFISDDGRIKLGDFGIMMDVSIRGADQQSFDSGLISSMIANKLHWMAPEVLQKKTLYNQPADVWSPGCTMVEMLTGSPPYKKFTTYDWITAYHSGLLTYDVQQLIPDLSDDLSDLLEQVFRRETLQQKLNSGSNQVRPSAGDVLIRLKEIIVERDLMLRKQEIEELRRIVSNNSNFCDEDYD